jgi:REP element-mobilizing transposase RayT
MPNHIHLLLSPPHRTGNATVFERLRGKVQSLASSIRASVSKPLQIHSLPEQPYLLELVRFIHVNPLREAGGNA